MYLNINFSQLHMNGVEIHQGIKPHHRILHNGEETHHEIKTFNKRNNGFNN